MGLFDSLRDLLRRSEEEAAKKATRAAVSAAAGAARDELAKVADGALGAAEGELEEAKRRREGRVEYRPSEGEAADIAAEIEAMVQGGDSAKDTLRRVRAEKAARAAHDGEDRARLELERRKAALRAARKESDDS